MLIWINEIIYLNVRGSRFFFKILWGGDGPEAHFISVILLLACKLIYNKFSGGGQGFGFLDPSSFAHAQSQWLPIRNCWCVGLAY